ncbi:homoserine kinase [Parvibium lacunae]|uniref:Homoserine kinase n=1 Tax=Parvibium lacunae TaxID=1888893 RepID=A0A368L6W7_9BURK|nr:homoserine kinase [Parvibium lacunae]RCS59251.1 homoserine kinase [Parvibium lacunae]
MAVFTDVSPAQLQDWLNHSNLGQLTALEGIASGIENTNYFVDVTRAGESHHYVLTLFEKLTPTELPFYLGLMHHLAAKGIPVPAPVRLSNGIFWGELNGKPCALVTRLQGRSVLQPSAAQCAAMGSWLARMHQAGADFALQQPNLRGLSWWQATAPVVAPYLPADIQRLLEDELALQTTHAMTTGYQDLPRGPVHADLFRDNALMIDDTLGGIIDFYFAGCDTWLFDLAVTLNDWCIDVATGELQAGACQAFLSAYHAVQPFTQQEAENWEMALRAAALRFWISRLYDFYLPRPAAMLTPKDPRHFERILIARRAGRYPVLPQS